jgi:hypothetical protein
LKPKYDELLSNVALKFNLRHYTEAIAATADANFTAARDVEAGAYTRPLFGST